MAGLGGALIGALLIAALSTFGDFVWARFISSHRPAYGLLHGTLLCLAIGLYLGALRRHPARGAAAGALIGLGAAGGFYLLAMAIGHAAMFVLWMALWAAFGLLSARGVGEPRATVAEALTRGALAAIGSGLAFFAISGIWTRPAPGGPNYPYHFLCWTVAFLPGFLALLVTRPRTSWGKGAGGRPPAPTSG
jgi:hypothetical protein